MAFESDDFVFIDVEEFINVNGKQVPSKGVRLIHKDTLKNFGESFQAQCRTMEWKAAITIHDKYRRKYDLGHEDLISLRKFAESLSESRKEQGKPLNKDFLIQHLSAEVKKRFADKPKQNLIGD